MNIKSIEISSPLNIVYSQYVDMTGETIHRPQHPKVTISTYESEWKFLLNFNFEERESWWDTVDVNLIPKNEYRYYGLYCIKDGKNIFIKDFTYKELKHFKKLFDTSFDFIKSILRNEIINEENKGKIQSSINIKNVIEVCKHHVNIGINFKEKRIEYLLKKNNL